MAVSTNNNLYAGSTSIQTCVVYKLDPTGQTPIELLVDLVPSTTGNRITIDLVDSENWNQTYQVTTNALQDLSDATNNVHRNPRTLSISGLFTGLLQSPVGDLATSAPPAYRSDLVKWTNLQQLAKERKPVLVMTPRGSMKSFITSISGDWTPETGEAFSIAISFTETFLVSPKTGIVNPDWVKQTTGNNTTKSVGQQIPQSMTQQFSQPTNPLGPPSIA